MHGIVCAPYALETPCPAFRPPNCGCKDCMSTAALQVRLAHEPCFFTVTGDVPQGSCFNHRNTWKVCIILLSGNDSAGLQVTRDRLMDEYHAKWPHYGFAAHKGYGTRQHMEALRLHGPCPIHRMSFAPLKAQLTRPLPKVSRRKNSQRLQDTDDTQ